MTLHFPRRSASAFTLVELLVVIAIIGILAALLLPALVKSEGAAKQAFCENNLKEVGISFHSFAHSHNDQFPMGVSTNDGGTLEYAQEGMQNVSTRFYTAYLHFQVLSNELAKPSALVCPTDTRTAAPNFALMQNANLSYFIGADAKMLDVNSILAGDRNVSDGGMQTTIHLEAGRVNYWTRELHDRRGNIVFGDGHVDKWNATSWAEKSGAGFPDNLYAFLPSVPTASGTSRSRSGSENMTFTRQSGPAIESTISNSSLMPGEPDDRMSPTDRHIAKVLYGTVTWSYFLLLLLALLYLGYRLWQILRPRKPGAGRPQPENVASGD